MVMILDVKEEAWNGGKPVADLKAVGARNGHDQDAGLRGVVEDIVEKYSILTWIAELRKQLNRNVHKLIIREDSVHWDEQVHENDVEVNQRLSDLEDILRRDCRLVGPLLTCGFDADDASVHPSKLHAITLALHTVVAVDAVTGVQPKQDTTKELTPIRLVCLKYFDVACE